jgi:hypothetical protein
MTSPQSDPVIEEIHHTRREMARKFNYDLAKITADARRRQSIEGRPVWQQELAVSLRHEGESLSVTDTDIPASTGSSAMSD